MPEPLIFRLRFHEPKKVFEGSKGRFFKNAPWQGGGQRPTKGERASHRGAPFQAGQSPFTKHPQIVRLGLYKPKKVFEGSKGRFFKNAPLAGRETGSHKERGSRPSGHAFSGRGVKRNDGYGAQIFAFFRSFPERSERGCRYGRRPRFPYR